MPATSTNPRRAASAACAAALLALAAGCGSARTAASGTPVFNVTEKDFRISAPARVPAGEVTLRVHNDGPDEHELIVSRAPASWKLPIREDGFTVNEEALEASEPGALEPGAPDATRTLSLKLAPGRYIFFCNMAGHFMGGMHADVVVE
jgi:uncharacterized cupredoxin-like copper-binding protein